MENSLTSWSVYRHISPSGKVYIGITSKDPKRRWNYGHGYNHCILFKNAILKYGWNNIKHEVVFANLTETRAKDLEVKLIRHYKNLGISYNITDGGDGHLGCSWTPSESTRELWSKQRIGRTLSDDWKSKISDSMKGRVIPKEVSKRGARRAKEISSISIVQLTTTGELIKEWASIREAASTLGISSPRDIIRCCRGERKTRLGFIWKYKEDYDAG